MKKLFLILMIIAIGNKSFSQKKILGEDYFKKELEKIKMKDTKIPSYLLGSDTLSFPQILQTINGVSILPQDNMPCFVPNVNKVAKMPVVKDEGFATKIPNAYNILSH
ncbi:MAG: hypothetical protein LH615_05790 [Ferruginibacter sp.]|nr:hypothetical protein [Ferruginibacter sp.]